MRYGNYPMSSPIPDEQLLGDDEVTRPTPSHTSDRSRFFEESGDDDAVNSWLSSLGLDFNPFFALNAADDPHLGQYLINLDVFDIIWGDGISLVFEPAGGGKTALRVQTSQACWSSQEINRPFPIPYTPPFLKWGSISPTLDDHLAELILAGAEQLFLGLCHRPHWFLNLVPSLRQNVCQVLTWSFSLTNLAASVEALRYHLDDLRQTLDLKALRQTLDPTFYVTDPPTPDSLAHFCSVLDDSIAAAPLPPLDLATRWNMLQAILLNQLHFPALYILLDGVDTTFETATDPETAVFSLAPLLSRLPDWSNRNVHLKGFLPVETKQVLRAQNPELLAGSRIASIQWDAARLVKLVRQRVLVASQGQFNSLDALVTPGLRDFEDMLVEAVVDPRPREVLVLINDVFAAHIRYSGSTGKIEDKDWELGLKTYRRRAMPVGQGYAFSAA